MRVKTFFRMLRIIAAVTLFFFSWSFLPFWQAVAYAVTPQGQGVEGKGQGSGKRPTIDNRPLTPVDRFEKALEEIRENISKAKEKAVKGEDVTREQETVKAKRAEIESADVELKKEFTSTEKKLKDAKLPQVILDRQAAFVKNYDKNLNQLKSEIDDIDNAKTASERKAKLEKTRLHLEMVKTAQKHLLFDPNKLPHRMVKLKERAPRLKKEDFEKDIPSQTKQRASKTAYNNWMLDINRGTQAQIIQKPLLLAFNDSFSGLPLSLEAHQYSSSPIESVTSVSPILLAQATQNPSPSQTDLSEKPEIQFTPEIRAKAQELGYKPVKIYEWVRNNIDYQPYYGSFKGAQQTLLEGAGNDFDQASLLIALLRVSQIEARYAYGTIEIPIEKVMNWVGGVTDPKIAGAILATKGIPAKLIIVGGVVKSVQLEHTWVDAWINYIPSRGAVHRIGHGDTWIPLDPSYKQFTYKQSMDMYAKLGFNGEQFLQSYITDTRDITAYQDYGTRLANYIDASYPKASVSDVIGTSDISQAKQIVKQEFPILLGTLPYKVVAKASQFIEVPTAISYSVTIQIDSDPLAGTAGLIYTGFLSNIADKRITVSYVPATTTDEALVEHYGGDLLSVPPYLINVKPVLRMNGSIVSTGAATGLGQDQNIIISFTGGDGDTDRIENVITAGNYSAIILQPQDTPLATSASKVGDFLENAQKVDSPSITIDDLLGQMLYSIGLSYYQKISFENGVYAKTLQLVNLRQPSEAMVTHKVKVNYLFGLPRTVSDGGVNIDVDRNVNSVYSPTQDAERIKAFMILSGLSSSGWENKILETYFNVPSVSSVRLLKLASEQGIPIYTINNTNLNDIIPQLQVDGDVLADIVNATNAGKEVIVSKTTISSGQWHGLGYIIIDPITGAASYQISGGLAGGAANPNPPLTQSQKSFYSAWATVYTRMAALILATAYLGTPYVYGSADPDCGFDCSGFVYFIFISVYGDKAFGNQRLWTVAAQHDFLKSKGWTYPYAERLPGDIVWKSNYKHTGINYGLGYVIHASGAPCRPQSDPNGWLPPAQCIVPGTEGSEVICGEFRRVVITSIDGWAVASEIGRPTPY